MRKRSTTTAKVVHALCRHDNLRFVRVLYARNCIVRFNSQFIHSLLRQAVRQIQSIAEPDIVTLLPPQARQVSPANWARDTRSCRRIC